MVSLKITVFESMLRDSENHEKTLVLGSDGSVEI